jgi:2-dehydropantoate 2-reductase
MSGLTAVTRQPIGKLRDDPDIWALLEAIMRETEAVGRARGVPLAADVTDKRLAMVRNTPPTVMASMANDLLRGNRLELPWLAGKVAALGRQYGIPTPANSFILAALKPYANGTPA